MRLHFDGFSERGKRDGVNQDSIGMFAKEDRGLFLVSDGMGGHSEGERASGELLNVCRNWWNQYLPNENQDFLQAIDELKMMLAFANQKIIDETPAKIICGATIVLLFIHGENFALLWSGDSRCYIGKRDLVGFNVTQVTRDDTWENQEIIKSTMKNSEILKHSNYGKLVRAVGVSRDFVCNTYTGRFEKNVLFALCSDGVYKYASAGVLKKAMRDVGKGNHINMQLEKMRNDIYKNGAPDNLSCIFIKVDL